MPSMNNGSSKLKPYKYIKYIHPLKMYHSYTQLLKMICSEKANSKSMLI